jgi:aryl-alcohol dehydrogenase-like predicted oxidoreductase
MVDIALDARVNAFDTANLYSMGDAELVPGKVLAGRRDKVLLISKGRSKVERRLCQVRSSVRAARPGRTRQRAMSNAVTGGCRQRAASPRPASVQR